MSTRFDYSHLSKWIGDLSDHLVAGRKPFKTYPLELGTLKYFLDEELEYFKSNYSEIYKEYEPSVNAFYDRLEQAAGEKRSQVMQFLTLAAVAVISAMVSAIVVFCSDRS
jgi:hypothetical protein